VFKEKFEESRLGHEFELGQENTEGELHQNGWFETVAKAAQEYRQR